jgi:carboxymethylenebutenolidase
MYGSLPVPVGSGYRRGYLARPDRAGRFPAVILVPDLDGLTAHEKALARRLARRGIVVVAVDLYGSSGADESDALASYHEFDDGDAVRILDETQEYLASDDIDWAIHRPVGILGLEVGGRFALIQAAHRDWVGAAAVAYAPLTGDEDRRYRVADLLEHIARPVLGLYGADDELIDADSVDEAQRRNISGQWLLYEGAGHGFMNDSGPGYEPAAAEDAVARIVSFFMASLPTATEAVVG